MNSFWEKKKVLIIGGTGFVGKNFVAFLEKIGANVYYTSRTDQKKSTTNFFKLNPTELEDFAKIEVNFDVLINCAALDGNGFFKKQFSNEICDTNSRISLNVLNFAKRKKISDVVMFSSAEIYSDLKKKKIKEIDLKLDALNYSQGYRTSKIILEMLATFYSLNYPDMRIYLPRPSYVYGLGDKYIDDKNSRLIPLLIHNIQAKKQMTFFGGKTRRINLIYVEDLIDAVLKMIENKKVGPLNITSPELLNVAKIISHIAESLNQKPKIVFEKTNLRPGFLMNNEELMKIKADFTPFKDGIANTLKRIS